VTEINKAVLSKERTFTPGGFANVERQSRLSLVSSDKIQSIMVEYKMKITLLILLIFEGEIL
jgi:hypothetical protein